MIKIIEDKQGYARWFVDEERIYKNVYMGAISIEVASHFFMEHDKTSLEALLSVLKNKKRPLAKVPTDIIRPMNLTEYFMLSKLLKITESQYNKKTNKFHQITK